MSYPEVYYEFYNKLRDIYMNAITENITTYDEFCEKINRLFWDCMDDPDSSIIWGEGDYYINEAREAEAKGIALKDYAFDDYTTRQAILKKLENM